MALHPILSPTSAQTIARLGVTALRTAQSMQTRKGGSAFYPTGDGQGVLVGGMADHGVDKWDPETGEQSPLWEDELDAKATEILGAAKEDTAAQITIVNTTITEATRAIESNREGLEQEAYLRAEADRAAQETTAAIKTETDKLKDDYAGMATDVANVQASVVEAVTKADTALTTANGKNRRYVQPAAPADTSVLVQGDEWWQTSSKPLETYWTGEPNNSTSVLVDHSNEVEHVFVWNGSRWNEQVLSAEHLLVPGTISAGLVSAEFFDGAVVKGGAFLTSNERIQLNNSGFFVEDAQGNPVVTINAANGDATFQSVNIIGAGLSTPAISGGTIEGADYKLTTGTGENKQIVARINSDGVTFGDHLSYAKNGAGQWVLSLAGAIQSGGEISSAVITAPTIQTSRDTNTGIKFTSGGLVAYDTDGNTTFTLDNAGQIMMAGALLSNATLTAPILQTNPAENRGIKIAGQTFTAFRNDGTKMINIDVNGTGVAEFTGTFRTGSSGSVMEMLSYSSGVSSVQGGGQLRSVIGDKTIWNMWGHYGESGYAGQLWEYTWGLGVAGSDFLTAKVTNTGSQMFIQADTVRISSTTAGGGVYVNNRRIDWEQSWTNLPLANGATAVGTAQYGQRAGLLVFRGRIKCTGSGDCDLFDLSSIYGGFETSTVNRTWIIGTMTNGLATTARAYIPANSTMLMVNNGPHDWVDIGSIVIGL